MWTRRVGAWGEAGEEERWGCDSLRVEGLVRRGPARRSSQDGGAGVEQGQGTYATITRFGFEVEQTFLEDPYEVAGRNRCSKDRVALLAAVRLSRGGRVGEGAFVCEGEASVDVTCVGVEPSVLARCKWSHDLREHVDRVLSPCCLPPVVHQSRSVL